MPVAFCKPIYSRKLVFEDVVAGLPKVGRIPPGVPMKESAILAGFFIGVVAQRIERPKGVRLAVRHAQKLASSMINENDVIPPAACGSDPSFSSDS